MSYWERLLEKCEAFRTLNVHELPKLMEAASDLKDFLSEAGNCACDGKCAGDCSPDGGVCPNQLGG